MNLTGVGVVSARGRGIGSLEEALREGWKAPSRKQIASSTEEMIPVYSVEEKTIIDKAVLKKMRRADRFSKMAVLAAWDAVRDGGIEIDGGGASLGIILATAFGPQVTAFRFLDEIIDHGEASVSPTLFSHSVHNAAASYVAFALDNHGPTLTVTQFGSSFQQALILARAWLHEGRCEHVLVGSVEECGAVMEYICSKKLRIADDGRIRPFEFSRSPSAVPGEGSVFLLLSGEDRGKKYCELGGVFQNGESADGDPDLRILDADGMSEDETCYRAVASQDVPIAGYSPLFGSMLTGSAFHCASAALMLMRQMLYACPVQDNPHGIRVCTSTEARNLDVIQCVSYSCFHERSVIELRR
jgi:3-oxoacyl-[acyl-carrier-protein] synthase II